MSTPAIKKILVIVSFLFYVVACCITAYKTPTEVGADGVSQSGGMLGITCLAFGWLSFTTGFTAFVAWLANFPYFINVVIVLISKKMSLRIVSVLLAVISLFLSFGAFGVSQIMKDEAGNMETVTLGPGLFVWVISFVIMIVAAILPAEVKKVEVEYINNPNPMK